MCVDKSWVGVFWVTMAAAAAMAAINLVMREMGCLNSRYGPRRPEERTAKSPFLTTGPDQKNSGAPRAQFLPRKTHESLFLHSLLGTERHSKVLRYPISFIQIPRPSHS